MQPEALNCPNCGMDVMTCGFTLRAEITRSYMRFTAAGLVLIATTQAAANKAECMNCGKALPWTPADLMRLA